MKSKSLEKRAVNAEHQALQRQNEAVHARAISSFMLESVGDPDAGAAPFVVMSDYLPGTLDIQQMGWSDISPSGSATIVIDATMFDPKDSIFLANSDG